MVLKGRLVINETRALDHAAFDQIRRIGVNLNQAVYKLHAFGRVPPQLIRAAATIERILLKLIDDGSESRGYRLARGKLKEQQKRELDDLKKAQADERRKKEELRLRQVRERYKEIGDPAQDITKPKSKAAKDFGKARDIPEEAADLKNKMRARLRDKMAERRYKEIAEQAEDIT